MSKKKIETNKLAEIAFEDSLSAKKKINDGEIEKLIGNFEDAAQINEDGVEFWYARDLQHLLGYERWENFFNILNKAKIACETAGYAVADHFRDVTKMVEIGSGAYRDTDDIKLNRYACYLVAQNGDSRKEPIAFAQTYFAIQTRRQEIQDNDVRQYIPLPEDHKRLLLRDEIKEHNKNWASTAKNAGVVDPVDFAVFQTFGYKGLYGGLDRTGIQRKKGLKSKEAILDHMGSTELAANLFRATQTEEKLRRDRIHGRTKANHTHYEVGKKVRQAIEDIGGTMPEDLPPAEDIKKVGRRLQKALESSQKPDKKIK